MKVGDKILGFKFFYSDLSYVKEMDNFIGKVGTIITIIDDTIEIDFNGEGIWWYPKEEAKLYLVDETIKVRVIKPNIIDLDLGKVYPVLEQNESYYRVLDDVGHARWIMKEYFSLVKENDDVMYKLKEEVKKYLKEDNPLKDKTMSMEDWSMTSFSSVALEEADYSVDLSSIDKDEMEEVSEGFIEVAKFFNYRDKAFWLNPNYNWELKYYDKEVFLEPTKK